MRFLVDMQLSPKLAEWLRTLAHDAVHVAELSLNKAPDSSLITLAGEQSRIIITANLDFPRLLSQIRSHSPGLVLLRGGNFSASEALDCVRRVLMAVPPDVLEASLTVVDRKRIRVRQLPLS